jgi:hypothetical protein
MIASFIGAMIPTERIADPEAAAFLVHKLAVESALAVTGLHGEPPISRERCRDALAALLFQAAFK